MGTCISKCKPDKNPQGEIPCLAVQDKQVISQTRCSSSVPVACSSSSSTGGVSVGLTSSSCTQSSLPSTTSSASSSASILCSKERSFSNEFLLSCIRYNQHIIKADDLIKIGIMTTLRTKGDAKNGILHSDRNDIDLAAAKKKQQSPNGVAVKSDAQKRPRASSRNPTRQKSIRREPNRFAAESYISSRNNNLKSPSPSRRFAGGDSSRRDFNVTPSLLVKDCTRQQCSKANAVQNLPCVMKENLRPPSPNINSKLTGSGGQKGCVERGSSTIKGVPRVVPKEDVESMPEEDIDNPLIALDCFIFL